MIFMSFMVEKDPEFKPALDLVGIDVNSPDNSETVYHQKVLVFAAK